MRVSIAVVVLTMASASHAAAQPEHYALRDAADLARVCATPSTSPDAATAAAFCHGFLAGAYTYSLAVTSPAERLVCPPDPAPSRSKVANDFVTWMKARPQLARDNAADALFRFAAEVFPCKR